MAHFRPEITRGNAAPHPQKTAVETARRGRGNYSKLPQSGPTEAVERESRNGPRPTQTAAPALSAI